MENVVRTIPSINEYVRRWKEAENDSSAYSIESEVKENWNNAHYELFLKLITA